MSSEPLLRAGKNALSYHDELVTTEIGQIQTYEDPGAFWVTYSSPIKGGHTTYPLHAA
jgi:hypothetical protein